MSSLMVGVHGAVQGPSERAWSLLGPVQDDWDAAERRLSALAARRPPVSPLTLDNYRREVRRLRWYCEAMGRPAPSSWTIPDATDYLEFLRSRSGEFVCLRRDARPGDLDWTPFRKMLGHSALANCQKVLHALQTFWFESGYRVGNPMAAIGSGGGLSGQVPRRHAVPPDLIDLVIALMEQRAEEAGTEAKLTFVRDRFLLRLLQHTGLRATEVVLGDMGDVELYADPDSQRVYWSLFVRHGKGGKTGRVALPPPVMDALRAYRYAFGMAPDPASGERVALVLSVRTCCRGDGDDGRWARVSTRVRRGRRMWAEVRRRATLWDIVRTAFRRGADELRRAGRLDEAVLLERASTHWLRHTFGRQLSMRGLDVRIVAKAMRHGDIRTTMGYTEMDFLDVVRALDGPA